MSTITIALPRLPLPSRLPTRQEEITQSRSLLSGTPRFDRDDTYEAYWCYMVAYHVGQESKVYALTGVYHRLGRDHGTRLRPSLLRSRAPEKLLTPNGKLLYRWLVKTNGMYIRDRRGDARRI